jgi:hypothetical protein
MLKCSRDFTTLMQSSLFAIIEQYRTDRWETIITPDEFPYGGQPCPVWVLKFGNREEMDKP